MMPTVVALVFAIAALVVTGVLALVRGRAQRRKPAPWPTPSYDEVMKTDAILRKLSGADEADKRAERRREARAEALARSNARKGEGLP